MTKLFQVTSFLLCHSFVNGWVEIFLLQRQKHFNLYFFEVKSIIKKIRKPEQSNLSARNSYLAEQPKSFLHDIKENENHPISPTPYPSKKGIRIKSRNKKQYDSTLSHTHIAWVCNVTSASPAISPLFFPLSPLLCMQFAKFIFVLFSYYVNQCMMRVYYSSLPTPIKPLLIWGHVGV